MANFWNSLREIFSLIGTAVVAYLTGRKVAEKDERIKELEGALKGAKRVQEVPVNTERDAALARLRKLNKVRDE